MRESCNNSLSALLEYHSKLYGRKMTLKRLSVGRTKRLCFRVSLFRLFILYSCVKTKKRISLPEIICSLNPRPPPQEPNQGTSFVNVTVYILAELSPRTSWQDLSCVNGLLGSTPFSPTHYFKKIWCWRNGTPSLLSNYLPHKSPPHPGVNLSNETFPQVVTRRH